MVSKANTVQEGKDEEKDGPLPESDTEDSISSFSPKHRRKRSKKVSKDTKKKEERKRTKKKGSKTTKKKRSQIKSSSAKSDDYSSVLKKGIKAESSQRKSPPSERNATAAASELLEAKGHRRSVSLDPSSLGEPSGLLAVDEKDFEELIGRKEIGIEHNSVVHRELKKIPAISVLSDGKSKQLSPSLPRSPLSPRKTPPREISPRGVAGSTSPRNSLDSVRKHLSPRPETSKAVGSLQVPTSGSRTRASSIPPIPPALPLVPARPAPRPSTTSPDKGHAPPPMPQSILKKPEKGLVSSFLRFAE